MSTPTDLTGFNDCITTQHEPLREESDLSDILSSDSDESSLDELSAQLEKEQRLDARQEPEKSKRQTELERMYFYSIYIDSMPPKDKQESVPLASEGFGESEIYDKSTRAAMFAEASNFVIDEIDEKKFKEVLKTDINEDERIEDIDGNISVQTMCERNFKALRMDGPSRRVALLFSYELSDRPVSFSFLHFMQQQKEKYPFIGGVLLYYPSGIGIHIVEGSEYALLMHFPSFFKSECFKRLIKCKVLAVEELSSKKYFEQYSCYKGNPRGSNTDFPKRVDDFSTTFQYLKQIGSGLSAFLEHVYKDFPSVTEENGLPEKVELLLPSKELLEFVLTDKRWKPGLREVNKWYNHLMSVPGETDNSEFVWPSRSDLLPVHLFHPAPGEEEMLINDLARKIRESKLEGIEAKVTPKPKNTVCCSKMEPLSSKVLNDQILFMRKEVKKVIVHQIHGLTRKIDQLRMKKGTEEQKEINGAKADNFASEVLLLKKMKPDEVSLFALSNREESELSRLIAKQVISLQTRAIAKLCLRENMRSTVNDFITKYSDSLELLNDLINDRYDKDSASNKKKKRRKRKSKKSDTEDLKISDVDKKLSDSDESIPQLVPISKKTASSEEIEEYSVNEEFTNDNSESDEENDSVLESFSDAGSHSEKSGEESENDNTGNDIKITKKEGFLKREWKQISTASNTKNIMLEPKYDNIAHKNLVKHLSSVEETHENIDSSNKKHSWKENRDSKTVDPFFKTKDDLEYLTYCDIKTPAPNEQSNLKEFNDERDIPEGRYGRGSFRGHKGSSFRGGRNSGSFRDRSEGNSFRGGNNRGSFRGRREGGFFTTMENRGSFRGMHGRGSFTGRENRSSFRGRHDGGSFKERENRGSFRGGHGNSTFKGGKDRDSFKGNSFNEGFKKNLNEKDNSSFNFQSKKPKIGEFNRRERRALDAEKTNQGNIKIHPSWEAKKNLQKVVVPFQGKKITFDD